MKKILSGIFVLISAIIQGEAIYLSPSADNFPRNNTTALIYNASAVPLKITNNIGSIGGIFVATNMRNKSKVQRQRHKGQITLNSGAVAIPASYKHQAHMKPNEYYVHLFTPIDLSKSQKAPGWSGPPIVTYKKNGIKLTKKINKNGYWIFTDHGVYFADHSYVKSNRKGIVDPNITG